MVLIRACPDHAQRAGLDLEVGVAHNFEGAKPGDKLEIVKAPLCIYHKQNLGR